MNPCKRLGCSNPARKDYCTAACRKAAWRETHFSLGDLDVSCPHCLKVVHHLVQNGVLHAPERQEGAVEPGVLS